ncbi:MAG TPA: hypothetical protein VFK57_13915 [Vicinamibacterales bacterium]|nr:hypothetical protein [Vicinamibacterales bacterium]
MLELDAAPPAVDPAAPLLARLRRLAHAALPRMYDRRAGRCVFTVRLENGTQAPAGISDRYTAIAIIGVAADGLDQWSLPFDPRQMAGTLVDTLPACRNLGDAALIAWAASAIGADTRGAWPHVERLLDAQAAHPTVELAWALAASVIDGGTAAPALRQKLSASLMRAWNGSAGIFAHVAGGTGARSHVACYADQVYPIFALSRYAGKHHDGAALDAAVRCARRICALQGTDGQWWWHYDHRTGGVIEGYPVYAIHQDAMGPMALRAVEEASGEAFGDHITRGLRWLEASPELNGGTLIDDAAQMLWRKVARREPMKATRYLQAACTMLHPRLRAPGVDVLFPPAIIDYEDRPYHWGWFLYAWARVQDRRS